MLDKLARIQKIQERDVLRSGQKELKAGFEELEK
jgi:hypothetical protein